MGRYATAQPVRGARSADLAQFVRGEVGVMAVQQESPTVVLALRRADAARALGISDETFDKHVRPSLPVVRAGGVSVYPVAALEQWLAERAESPVDELERRLR
jgi:hypothetical protein